MTNPSPTIELRARSLFANMKGEMIVHERVIPTFAARIAIELVEKWGLVAAAMDGEDSAGRQKMRAATPSEVVDRACETTELLIEAFNKRDWLVTAPSLDELADQVKTHEDKEEAEREARKAKRAT